MSINPYFNKSSFVSALLCVLMILGAPNVVSQTTVSAKKQHADFYNIVYSYFNQEYGRTLALIDIAQQAHQFIDVSKDDTDRIRLMQAASQLNMGLLAKAQASFRVLLGDNTSEYVKARTWYWIAKAAFEQQQFSLSSEAYKNIVDFSLKKYLTQEQWQELSYYSAYSKLLSVDSNEELTPEALTSGELTEKLSPTKIYASYLLAAKASVAYNNGDYSEAEQGFIRAKQALLLNQRLQGSRGKSRIFRFGISSSLRWLYGGNTTAQGNIEEDDKLQLIRERDALFDSLNLHLAYALIKQKKYQSSLDVLNNVALEDGQSQQARLVLGWTLAREYRWDLAANAFQTLVEDGGSYAMQAKYAQAFSFQEQGLLNKAFFSLDEFIQLVDGNLEFSQDFKSQVLGENFFDSFDAQWPSELLDMKREFLAESGDNGQFDAVYLLEVRKQAREILSLTREQQAHLAILKNMLSEREASFQNRQNELSLTESTEQLVQVKQRIDAIQQLLSSNDNQTQQSLKVAMLPTSLNESYQRLKNGQQRHQRLLTDPDNTRPVKPELAERLARVDGILKWYMDDTFIAQRWQYKRLLDSAKEQLKEAENALESVAQAQQNQTQFAEEKSRIEQLSQTVLEQQNKAQTLFSNTEARLSGFLVSMIDQRIENLKKQSVSARLQRIRIQDLYGEEQVVSKSGTRVRKVFSSGEQP